MLVNSEPRASETESRQPAATSQQLPAAGHRLPESVNPRSRTSGWCRVVVGEHWYSAVACWILARVWVRRGLGGLAEQIRRLPLGELRARGAVPAYSSSTRLKIQSREPASRRPSPRV